MRKSIENFNFFLFQYFWQKLLHQERRCDSETENDELWQVGEGKAFALLHQERQVVHLAFCVRRISWTAKDEKFFYETKELNYEIYYFESFSLIVSIFFTKHARLCVKASNVNFPWYEPIPLGPTPPNGSVSTKEGIQSYDQWNFLWCDQLTR